MNKNNNELPGESIHKQKTGYFLIFKDKDHKLIICNHENLTEIYNLIIKNAFPQGSYTILKGEQVV